MMKMEISKKEFCKKMYVAIMKKQFSSFVYDNPYTKFSSFKFYRREGYLNIVLNFDKFSELRIRVYVGYNDKVRSMPTPQKVGLWADDLFWRLQKEVSIQENWSCSWSNKAEYHTIVSSYTFEGKKDDEDERKEELEENESFFD